MTSTGSFRLTVRQGPAPGKVYELVKDVVTIGRDVSNDISIPDAEVSRNHARLTAQSAGYLIEDLASTNGTFVNGQRLTGPKLLDPNDVVGLGETVVLEYGGAAADAGATVIAGPRVVDEFAAPPPEPEIPPPPPIVEPMGVPTYNEPAFASPPPAAPPPPPAYTPPPADFGAPMAPPAPKRDNRPMIAGGIGCGCLTLCLCLAAAVYSQWPAIAQMLGF